MLKVLMVASEMTPYAKTGGLADVIGSLPAALLAQGVDVRVVMPRYGPLQVRGTAVVSLGLVRVPFDGAERLAEIQQAVPTFEDGATSEIVTYFVEAPHLYRRSRLYGYDDDLLRFGFFCRAVLEMLHQLHSLHWCPDIIHCHDWHTGLLPVYLRTAFSDDAELGSVKTVFSIHNLAYQGLAPKELMPRLGLGWELFNAAQLEYFDKINPMKAGLVFADELTSVSEGYAHEIQTAAYGEGLDGVLRARAAHLTGIVNGIDYTAWHPLTDPFIGFNYSALDFSNKAKCKRELLELVGLPGASGIPGTAGGTDEAAAADSQTIAGTDAGHSNSLPVIGMVSRLSAQKGLDFVAEIIGPMLNLGCLFVLLGNGDESYLQLFDELGRKYAGRVSMNLGKFNEKLAHHIYAGSDLFLMPSRYEPCGLGQMIALSYGTVPVVRATGGLADTVSEWDEDSKTGNGFVFVQPNGAALYEAVQRAVRAYKGPAWPNLVRNAFAKDFSWDAGAARYKALYRELVPNPRQAYTAAPPSNYALV